MTRGVWYDGGIMVELRPYQRDLLRPVRAALASGSDVQSDARSDARGGARVMLQLPTGGGKTVIAGALLADWLAGGQRKAAWLTHRRELAEQTGGMLTEAGVSAITNVNWTPGEDAPAMAGGAVILMAQTVSRRNIRRQVWGRYGAGDLLIIDEAHHAAAPGWERAIGQWPGPVLGMTATPWRLSETEGFDHLFGGMECGPSVAELQELGALCRSRVMLPPPEQRIAGGVVDRATGDYTEAGIVEANVAHPEIMTAGALAFWQRFGRDAAGAGRPTIAYAVSVEHARNLAAVFQDAGAAAAVLLGDTGRAERDAAIAGFRDGSITVLVNVLVATEGFDLPDASCIIIARPTMSLALYLQMAGRGLRPKEDGGDCIILDLAGDSVRHGLPETARAWSLAPRGRWDGAGEAPAVWCEKCFTASHAASHNCGQCGSPFGKDCGRCGQWRVWRWWQYETHCGDAHQPVCDRCHIDAHIRAHLPVTPPLDGLVDIYDWEDGDMTPGGDFAMDDDLAGRLSALFGELLAAERQAVAGADDARRRELQGMIEQHEAALDDETALDALFEEHIGAMTAAERPRGRVQVSRALADWEGNLRSELAGWRRELAGLESRPVDKEAIFGSARGKAMYLLRREAAAADLLVSNQPGNQAAAVRPAVGSPTPGNGSGEGWIPLPAFVPDGTTRPAPPQALRFATTEVVPITRWNDVLVEIANWLIRSGKLSASDCPVVIGRAKSYFINTTAYNHDGRRIKNSRLLSNGAYIHLAFDSSNTIKRGNELLQHFGVDPALCEVLVGAGFNVGNELKRERISPYQHAALSDDGDGVWLSLSDLDPDSRDKPEHPKTLRFPNGYEVSLRGWYDILVSTAQWLITEGRLRPDHCPITLGNARRSLLNTAPTYAGGYRMRAPRQLSNGIYIESNYASTELTRHSKTLLRQFGVDPGQCYVQLR